LPSGITGGFAPPEPKAVKSVAYTAKTNTLQITSSASGLAQTEVQKDHTVDALVKELQSILKSIPSGDPQSGEDIYGLDTSIAWGSDELEWRNVNSGGCGGTGSVQVTDEHKKKFKRALAIADELVAKGAGS
jgi:hypothetical protein